MPRGRRELEIAMEEERPSSTPVTEPAKERVGGVQSIERAFAILEEVARHREGIRLGELSRRVGLHNSTTFHLVKTMVLLGYLRQMPGSKTYRVGRPLFTLAAISLAAQARIAFEVTSVRPNTTGETRASMRFSPGGDFTAVNQPVRVLLNFAYQIPLFRVEGMPDWFSSERFDVTAKAPAGLSMEPFAVVRGQLLRSLLEDRFKLKAHRETREMLVPYNASGDAAAPVARLTKAALERGLYLFVHWNKIMVAPPLTITREELEEGVAVLDEILAVADEYVSME